MSPQLGILVLGYARPHLLELVLESLQRQDALGSTHVWIDGTADRMEIAARPADCVSVARRFPVAALRAHRGHLGIEKLMLDALSDMNRRFERLLILEDDCFPARAAVATFSQALDAIEDLDDVFSVYGHHFLTPGEGLDGTRFQGWGWATTRRKLTPILDEARRLFFLPEHEYLDYTQRMLQPEILARLDVTPGRNVCHVLRSFFSWDSCTALLTATAGLKHRPTSPRVVYNCGLGGNSGHFPDDVRLRQPPFNMIKPEEAWNHF